MELHLSIVSWFVLEVRLYVYCLKQGTFSILIGISLITFSIRNYSFYYLVLQVDLLFGKSPLLQKLLTAFFLSETLFPLSSSLYTCRFYRFRILTAYI